MAIFCRQDILRIVHFAKSSLALRTLVHIYLKEKENENCVSRKCSEKNLGI